MTAVLRTEIYTGLAEALAVDTNWPVWLCRKGRDWPLWRPVVELAARQESPLLRQAVMRLTEVSATAPRRRQQSFTAVINQNERPLMLHEAHFLNGRLLGPQTKAINAFYQQCGVELTGGELPDHAAVELEFLAFLSQQETIDETHTRVWQGARKLFLAQHAGRWLPAVGRALAQADDPAWIAIGLLLTAVTGKPTQKRSAAARRMGLPGIRQVEHCSLCGFCTRVCPTQALRIQENNQATRLTLHPSLCVGCRQCVPVCPTAAIALTAPVTDQSLTTLRQSSRAICPKCGKPTISEAELTAVIAQIGHPPWLDYCLDCRSQFC